MKGLRRQFCYAETTLKAVSLLLPAVQVEQEPIRGTIPYVPPALTPLQWWALVLLAAGREQQILQSGCTEDWLVHHICRALQELGYPIMERTHLEVAKGIKIDAYFSFYDLPRQGFCMHVVQETCEHLGNPLPPQLIGL